MRADGTVMVWQFVSEGAAAPAFGEETEIVNKETWNIVRLLRYLPHAQTARVLDRLTSDLDTGRGVSDIYDLCWSPCSSFIATGSTDNTAMVWVSSFSQHSQLASSNFTHSGHALVLL